MRRILTAAATAAFVVVGLATPTWAAETEEQVTFKDDGPVDLSGDGTGTNLGERVVVGSISLTPGKWTINARTRDCRASR